MFRRIVLYKRFIKPILVNFCLTASFFLAFLLGMCARNSNAQDASTSSKTPIFGPHQNVEEKARLLQDNNRDTYRALADEIFKSPRGLGVLEMAHGIGLANIPAPIDNVIKDRLVYAEMQYRQGTGKAVREQSIVDAINSLVQKLGLPDYTRTSPAQVRFMRMFLIRMNPTFMGRGTVRPDMQVGESITDEMSPMQAVHLLLDVAGHKFFDPDFQMTPEAWDHVQASRRAKQTSNPTADSKITHTLVATINPKSSELRLLLVQRVNSMNPVEGYSLLTQTLEILGI